MGRGDNTDQQQATPISPTTVRAIPYRRLEHVYHLGTMNPADKTRFSYEGEGLSVSLDPDQWRRIAKLGGSLLHSLHKSDGKFVEAHELSETQIEQITEWGLQSGLVQRQKRWQLPYWDGESDQEYLMNFTDHQQALEELEEVNKWSADDPVKLIENSSLKGTEALTQRMGMRELTDAWEHLLVSWAEDNTDADGVWWDDEYDTYSAPRGVIFSSRLSTWAASSNN